MSFIGRIINTNIIEKEHEDETFTHKDTLGFNVDQATMSKSMDERK